MANDGWTHETNLVDLWLANDEGYYREVISEAEAYVDLEQGEDDINGFSNWLRKFVESLLPESVTDGIISDLFYSAFSEIDWYALAEKWLIDARESLS